MKIVINRSQADGKKYIKSNMELINTLLKTIVLSNWAFEK